MYNYKRLIKHLSLLSIVLVFSICFAGCGIIRNLIPNNTSSHMGGINITCEISQDNGTWTQEDIADVIYKLEQRAQLYSTMATVRSEGDNRIIIDIPGEWDADIIDSILSNSKLYFCTKCDYTPTDDEIADGDYIQVSNDSGFDGYYQIWVTGDQIADAQGVAYTGESGGVEYVVSLEFGSEGTDTFYNMTSQYVGQKTYIIYDGSVISAPTVMSAISGGNAQIDGMGSLEEAELLASNIRIGSLNLELNVIEYNVTEPK